MDTASISISEKTDMWFLRRENQTSSSDTFPILQELVEAGLRSTTLGMNAPGSRAMGGPGKASLHHTRTAAYNAKVFPGTGAASGEPLVTKSRAVTQFTNLTTQSLFFA